MKPRRRLPNTLHGLLRVALDDLAKVERDRKRYTVNMAWFYIPRPRNERCVVCAAGAVMAMSLGAGPSTEDAAVHSWGQRTSDKLVAIDYLRRGCVSAAYGQLHGYIENPLAAPDRPVTPYESSPADWRANMEELHAELRRAKL